MASLAPRAPFPLAELCWQTVESQTQGMFPSRETLRCPRKFQRQCPLPIIWGQNGYHLIASLLHAPRNGSHVSARCTHRGQWRKHRRVWPPLHRGNLKFKEDAISPSWVQMRIQSITQDFQKMIHALEELWCGIFDGRGEVINSPLLIVSKQVFPWLGPGSVRAGKICPFSEDREEILLKSLVLVIFNRRELPMS